MKLFGNLFGSRKESLARTVTTMRDIGKPVSTPANYEGFAKVGYSKSVLVYRCVSMIAGAARGMSFVLYDKKNPRKPTELETHPFLDLWRKPNPMQSSADLIENMVAFYCLTGNSYLEANGGAINSGLPLEIWNVRPDKMKVIPGKMGYPAAYEFSFGGQRRTWDVDIVSMKSPILHWKTFHPTNDWYGLSPMEAAMFSIDQNLAGQKYNLALLQNMAAPSGVLQVQVSDQNPTGSLTDEQFQTLRNQLDEGYTGMNRGRPMLLEGGLKWVQLSLSPRDLDYTKGKEVTAIDIAMAYGVPPELLGLGAKTFNNYREARLSFYEETVLPIMDGAMASINRWLSPAFGKGLCLEYDKDDIEVLQWKREQRYTSLQSSNFLTQNEKREAVGYQPIDGWDVFVIGSQVGALPDDFLGGGGSPLFGDVPPDDAEDEDQDKPDAEEDGSVPKPLQDDEEETDADAEEDLDMEDEKSWGWKSLNLVNANEKRSSWRKQNRRRKYLQTLLDRELKEDFKDLADILSKIPGNTSDPKVTEFAMVKALSDFMPNMHRTLKRHIRYTLEDFGKQIFREGKDLGLVRETKVNTKFDHYVQIYTETRSGEAIETITSTTRKRIQKVVGEWVQTAIVDGDTTDELSRYINLEFEELSASQATRIARTEVALASNNGTLEAVKSLQVPNMFKEWVTANDHRVRDGSNGGADHGIMNGAEVGLDEKFGVPPDALMEGPGDPSAGADQVINCRCVLVYRSKN